MRLARLLAAPLGVLALVACGSNEALRPVDTGKGGAGGATSSTTAVTTGGGGGAGQGGSAPSAGGGGAAPAPTGALVSVAMDSEVGVLLDELPVEQRDRVAAGLLAKPTQFWLDRATRQLELTAQYGYFTVKPVPLPPRETWSIALAARGPARTVVNGHDVVSVAYAFKGTLLSDLDSPEDAHHKLGSEGGKHERLYELPLDPDLLTQRIFHDCQQSGFFLYYPNCPEVVAARIGRVDTYVHYERLPWDAALADAVRVGVVTNPVGPDFAVMQEGLDENRLVYAYIAPDSCAIAEGCVGGPGWRRLLQFTATVHNIGKGPMHVGSISSSELTDHNIYEYSDCHEHYHFTHYGDFTFGDQEGDKKAFCLISTGRYSNNETTPLVTDYEACDYQGVESGWGDDYGAGLDCQWVDVTDVDVSQGPVTAPLRFSSNPDYFLCEGAPVLDAQGDQVFAPTAYTTEGGLPVDRPLCDFTPAWSANNERSADVTIPKAGSYVTAPCKKDELGPLRDCGFVEQDATGTCTPGATVTLTCAVADATVPQALRVCETSAKLGTGLACAALRSLGVATIGAAPTEVTFTCPAARDAEEPGGAYALFTAPLFGEDPSQVVSCN